MGFIACFFARSREGATLAFAILITRANNAKTGFDLTPLLETTLTKTMLMSHQNLLRVSILLICTLTFPSWLPAQQTNDPLAPTRKRQRPKRQRVEDPYFNPFEDSDSTESTNPFSDENDPFKSPADNGKPHDDSNPFADPNSGGKPADPFADPFKPNNAPTTDDPFATDNDPFGTPAANPPVHQVRISAVPVTQSSQSDSRIPYVTSFTSNVDAEAEARAVMVLNKTIDLEVIETPLEAVATHISEVIQFPIALDSRALDEYGIGVDTPITANVKQLPLKSALEVILRPLDLFVTFRNGRLEFTTLERLEEDRVVRLYDVSDLVNTRMGVVVNGTASSKDHADNLVDAIQSLIQPESWEEVGGSGVIKSQGHVITVTQNWPIQNEVLAYLNSLSEISIARSANTFGFGSFSTRVYRLQMATESKTRVNGQGYTSQSERSSRRRVGLTVLGTATQSVGGGMGGYTNVVNVITDITHGPTLKQLMRLIKKTVAPASWQGRYGGSIKSSGGMLIISQSSDIHTAVERFLREIGAMHPASSDTSGYIPLGGGSFGHNPSQVNQDGGFQD